MLGKLEGFTQSLETFSKEVNHLIMKEICRQRDREAIKKATEKTTGNPNTPICFPREVKEKLQEMLNECRDESISNIVAETVNRLGMEKVAHYLQEFDLGIKDFYSVLIDYGKQLWRKKRSLTDALSQFQIFGNYSKNNFESTT